MQKYDHKKIEKKWQKLWEETHAFKTEEGSSKPKAYILDMFPYPSGAGLHVGHVEGYTATDIYSRYMRATGHNVLHPMGWDAFGLPAENYAIKTGTPPRKTTDESIDNFRKQIKNLGLSYDWSREFGTHTPEYYKWTQWLFNKFFEKGLVYKKKALVNWDPVDQTVLANEQVLADGTAERSGAVVEQKELEQWFYKITDYADELVDDLEKLDWPESTKINQRNWIGKSVGAEITWKVVSADGVETGETLVTFTTRKDTVPGVTFIVLAPESEYAKVATAGLEESKDYIVAAKNRTDLERISTKQKTGAATNWHAKNPFNGFVVPVYIADYVLAGYGTGAVMGMPGHDERDLQFAELFSLPSIFTTEVPKDFPKENVYTGEGIQINTGEGYDGLTNTEAAKKIFAKLEAEGTAKAKIQYRLRDWLISRQRYWGAPIPIVYDPDGKPHAVPDEHLPWKLPEDVEYLPKGTSPLGTSKELLERTERIFGKGWKPEIDTMDTFACSSWYFFRFADPHNSGEFASKEAMQKWLPVDLYVGGAEHTVLHLLYARFYTKALRDMGYLTFDEPFLKLRHQGIILAEDSRKMSKRWGNVINPDDIVELFGADSVRLYEMFMGPLEAMKPWNTNNVMGVRRFLERIWNMQEKIGDVAMDAQTETLLHQTIQKVTSDIEALKVNTAVSSLMIFSNHLAELKEVPKAAYGPFLKLLNPFAPHMCAEIAAIAGYLNGAIDTWPAFDPSKIVASTVQIGVQINGKVRATIELAPDATEDEALALARSNGAVAKWLSSGQEKKAVYVPGKIVNFVVG